MKRTFGIAITMALAVVCMCAVEADETKDSGKAGYLKKAALESADGRFSVELGSRVQFRFTQEDPESGDSTGSFRIRRAKLAITGKLYEYWDYKIQAVWSGGSTTLEDAYFQYTRHSLAQPWLGQGKAFFGRQELTSSGKQQFVDRSIASGRFAPSRDQGIGVVGHNVSKTFEYNAGMYNGNGRNQSSNDDDDFMYVARALWTPFGEYKLEESALDYPASSKLALGASVLTTTQPTTFTTMQVADPLTGIVSTISTPAAPASDIDRLGAEIAYKLKGFSAVGEYYTESSDPDDPVFPAALAMDTDGFYVQVGYLFPNKRFEVAARLAELRPDLPSGSPSADETERGIGVSWYFNKHDYKLQADYRKLEFDADPADDTDEIRVQFQLSF